MATKAPSSATPTSAEDYTDQYRWESRPQDISPSVWDEAFFNNVLGTGDVIKQEQQHIWAVKPSTSSEFLLPESPKLKQVEVVRGPTSRTPPPLLSHQPAYFNSEEEDCGFYIAPEDQLQLADGFLLSQLSNGQDPSVAQQATMRYLPDQFGEGSAEGARSQNARETSFETSFGGSLEFFSNSFFKNWDMGIQDTVKTAGCSRENSGKTGR
ncbi:unnamed protein product [Clonostachys rosea]|uniref:Uncharacterized protein n=1 Tax=Bionectria ochroleuca TaxID=29856 RepID=A0ABY6TN86_BIOOC|nr:unnamed protein product [Clonostachys rosea]